MTWIEYNEQVFKLVKFFGGDLYQKKNIEDGWVYWKSLDKQQLASEVEFAIFQNRPIDLKLIGIKSKPTKLVKYVNPDDHILKDYDPDYLDKLLKQNNASSLWDLVEKFKRNSLQT